MKDRDLREFWSETLHRRGDSCATVGECVGAGPVSFCCLKTACLETGDLPPKCVNIFFLYFLDSARICTKFAESFGVRLVGGAL